MSEDRLLRPLVHDPAVRAGLGDARLALVEHAHRLLDRGGAVHCVVGRLPQAVDLAGQLGAHSTCSRIAAAWAHSSSVGTSAMRT